MLRALSTRPSWEGAGVFYKGLVEKYSPSRKRNEEEMEGPGTISSSRKKLQATIR